MNAYFINVTDKNSDSSLKVILWQLILWNNFPINIFFQVTYWMDFFSNSYSNWGNRYKYNGTSTVVLESVD